jgi:glycosyltransferase involved in cell wall biosynthesis
MKLKNMKNPKVSIIVPYCFDRGYLGEALNSIHQQTYKDFEIILSESDNTVGYNFNKGLYKAKGDLICFLAEDDMLTPNSLEDRVHFMRFNDCDFIHGRAWEYWDNNGTKREYKMNRPDVTFESCLANNGIHGGTVMYRRESIQDFKMDESLWTGEEYDFNLNLLSNNKKLMFLDEVVYIYRRHNQQKSVGNLSNDYQQKRDKEKEKIRAKYR